jgi:hypothetical protein
MTVKIATWNVQRPSNGGPLNSQRLKKIEERDADIWILTETREVISLRDWHNLSSFPIPGYHAEGETLVTIWSKWPIRAISASRFTACAEIIIPSLGPSLIYGTVIPWDKDEGFSDRLKAGRWDEHRRQTKVQTSEWEVLAKSYPEHLLFILGDFNQHRGQVGSYRDNGSVTKISDSLFSCGLECITENSDKCANLSKPLVDHICLPKSLVASSCLDVWPYDEIDGVRLSDHHGVMVTIASSTAHQ